MDHYFHMTNMFQVLIGILTMGLLLIVMVTEAEVSSPYRYSNNCGQGLEVKVSSKFQVLIGILTIAGRFSDWLAEVQVSSPYRYSNNLLRNQ